MSRADFKVVDGERRPKGKGATPESETEDDSPAPPSDLTRVSNRHWLINCAIVLSLLWIGAAVFGAMQLGMFEANVRFNISEIGAIIAGFAAPLAVIWMFALVLQRDDPLLEHRLAISKGVHKTLAPIDAVEGRIDQIVKHLNREVAQIDAAVDLATSSLDSLEARFDKQIKRLVESTGDAETRASGVRDSLAGEREALGAVLDSMQDRLGGLEETVKRVTGDITQSVETAQSGANMASREMKTYTESLSETAASTRDALSEIASVLKEHIEAVDQTSDESQRRAENVTRTLDLTRVALENQMIELEEAASRTETNLLRQAESLSELRKSAAAEAKQIEESVNRQAGEMSAAAAGALAQTAQAGDAFEEQAEAMVRTVAEAVEKSKMLLEETATMMSTQAYHAREAGKEIGETAAEYAQEAREAFEEEAKAIEARATAALARAQETLNLTGSALADQIKAAENAATRVAEQALEDIQSAAGSVQQYGDVARELMEEANDNATNRAIALRATYEEQLKGMEERAGSSSEALTKLAQSLADQADMISRSSDEATKNLQSAGEVMDERSANLGQQLEETRMHLTQTDAQLTEQREALVGASEHSEQLLRDAAERLKARAAEIETVTEAATKEVMTRSEVLEARLTEIGQAGHQAAAEISLASSELAEQEQVVSTALSSSVDNLKDATATLGEEGSKVREHAGMFADVAKTMSDATQLAYGQMEHANSILERNAEKITEASDKAMEVAEETAKGVGEALSEAIDGTEDRIRNAVRNASSVAEMDLDAIAVRVETSLATTLDQLSEAATEAENQAAKTGDVIGVQAQRLVGKAELFVSKAEQLERRLQDSVQDDFVKTSSLLIESLHSMSFELDKILETNIPDHIWQKHLAGDKSVFTRRTLKLGNRHTRALIARKFDEDKEFREHVVRFTDGFELLMQRVMASSTSGALSVALVSSEIGKLYVLLGQALKKFK